MLFDTLVNKSAEFQSSSEIFLPHPPRCAANEKNTIKVGDKAIVTLASAKGVLIGHLQGFDLKMGNILLTVVGEDASRKVACKNIKRLQVTKFLKWVPANLPGILGDTLKPMPDVLDFKIEFIDDDTLEGRTLGFYEDKAGLHLFPEQENLHYFYTFIPHTAIRKKEIGKPIGKLLMQNGTLTETQIDDALKNQQSIRAKLLGEVLKSQAIVTTNDIKQALSQQEITPTIRLGEVLVSTGAISAEQLQKVLEFQKENRQIKIGDILVQQGLVTKKQIQQSLAQKFGFPLIDLRKVEIDFDTAKFIPEELARKHQVLPIMTYDKRLVVAVEDPLSNTGLEEIRFASQLMVEPVMCSAEDISDYIDRVYLVLDIDETDPDDMQTEGHDSAAISDNKVVRLANQIITDAYSQGISDIHLEPYGRDKSLVVRFRRDGILIPVKEIPSSLSRNLVARLKIMANLDIAERRKPQDGKIDFKNFGPLKIELRIATLPTAGGQEDVVLRILTAGEPIPLDNLGLNNWNSKSLKELITQPYGLFFVCGPTGSGKTTTLHSILAHINTPQTKIWTVEDPVEITQRGLRQVQVHPKIGLTFAAAMHSFLRADPDVIMVGEMRDQETTKMVIEASLTGHLVLSTLHTNSAPESVVRLLDMGMDPFNFSDALLGVLGQRLAKKLCSECKEAYSPSDEETESLLTEYCRELTAAARLPADDPKIRSNILGNWRQRFANDNDEFTLYRVKGCSQCDHTGYRGRLGLHELMVATEKIKYMVQKQLPVTDIAHEAIRGGMRTLRQDGIEKVLQGLTDLAQIKKVCIK